MGESATARDVTLHQFRYSHFNDKARWGLAWKAVPHRRVSWLPGPHRGPITKRTGQSATPVLEIDGEFIAGSAAILARLEAEFPAPSLLPADAALREAALALQRDFDARVGPAVRTALFSVLIDQPAYVCGMFAEGRGTIGRMLYRALFPVARPLMARANGVTDPANIRHAFDISLAALDEVHARSGGGRHLVGDAFSVADLTAAALLAPLVNPDHPDMRKSGDVPREMRAFWDRFAQHPGAEWVRWAYRSFRGPSCEIV